MTASTDAARLFLADVGAPSTAEMVAAVTAWAQHESGPTILGNNPWNLHVGPPCPSTARAGIGGLNPSQALGPPPPGLLGNRYAGAGDQNVAIFATLADGVAAAVGNLVAHGSDFAHYDVVLRAARAGNGLAFLGALAASAWSAGRYGTANGGPNVLIPLYRQILAQEAPEMQLDPSIQTGLIADFRPGASVYRDAARTVVFAAVWPGGSSIGVVGVDPTNPFGHGSPNVCINLPDGPTARALVFVGVDHMSNLRPRVPVPAPTPDPAVIAAAELRGHRDEWDRQAAKATAAVVLAPRP